MNDEVLVKVENVSKKFCRSLKRSLWYGMQDMLSELNPFSHRSNGTLYSRDSASDRLRPDEFWAVKDVSFELRRGECLGLIGRNGAGKTTLLKMLNGLIKPDQGCITMRGRVGALIGLGVGFNPILTGRENIYINGSVLGLAKREIDAKLDEIIDFSEISAFIDSPVQTYSSGMQVRLGFAVAAYTQPDILLADEVLAVGDIAFRAKCADKIRQLMDGGVAIIFVAHDMNAVQSLCNQVTWLESGNVRLHGPSTDVIEAYLRDSDRHTLDEVLKGLDKGRRNTGDIDIIRVVTRDASGCETDCIHPFDPLSVEIHYQATRRLEQPYFWIGIGSEHSPALNASMLFDGKRPSFVEGKGKIRCHFPSLPLLPQVYRIRAGIRAADGRTQLIESRPVGAFRVEADISSLGFTASVANSLSRASGPLLIDYVWEFQDGARQPVTVCPSK